MTGWTALHSAPSSCSLRREGNITKVIKRDSLGKKAWFTTPNFKSRCSSGTNQSAPSPTHLRFRVATFHVRCCRRGILISACHLFIPWHRRWMVARGGKMMAGLNDMNVMLDNQDCGTMLQCVHFGNADLSDLPQLSLKFEWFRMIHCRSTTSLKMAGQEQWLWIKKLGLRFGLDNL